MNEGLTKRNAFFLRESAAGSYEPHRPSYNDPYAIFERNRKLQPGDGTRARITEEEKRREDSLLRNSACARGAQAGRTPNASRGRDI